MLGLPRSAAHPALSKAERPPGITNYLQSGTFSNDWGTWISLFTYMQLQEHVAGTFNSTGGWEFYKRVLARWEGCAKV